MGSMTFISVATAAAALLLVYLALRAVLAVARFRRYELAIPGPPSLPVFGNIFAFAFKKQEDIFETLLQLWGQRRDLSRISLFNNLLVFVSKPEDIEAVMKRKDLQDKSHFYYDILGEWLPSGLLMLNGAKMKAHRAATMPAFRSQIVDSFCDVFAAAAEKFVERVVPGEEAFIEENITDITVWSFCRTAVFTETPSKEQELVLKDIVDTSHFLLNVTNERMFNPLLWPKWVWDLTRHGRYLKKKVPLLRTRFNQILDDCEETMKKLQGLEEEDFMKTKKSLIDVLLQKHYADKQMFSRDDIMDEIEFFLIAASETTVTVLSFTLKMLSLHPDIQQKLYEEVSGVLGSGATKRSVVAEDLPKLEYTECVLKEVMRALAPVPMIARQVNEDTELAGHVLPRGTTLVLNLFGLHRDPVAWPDPLKFDPDRFSPGQREGRHPYAYVPFSGGIRGCVGTKYAWASMKTVVATVIRDFVLEPSSDGPSDYTKFKLMFDVSLQLHGGVRVKFTRR